MKAKESQNGSTGKIIDVDAKTSDRRGLAGLFENILRRFRIVTYLIALIPLYLMVILAMSLSAMPGVYFVKFVLENTAQWPEFFHYGAIAFSLISSYFLYGFAIIFVVPLFNKLLPFRVKPFRGSYFSAAAVPWFFHNALNYVVRYTFLEFVTPTPLNLLFYRMMGMKIGKGAHINTTNISDPALIQIEDKVTIGGSVHLMAHYATKGYLIIEPIIIREGATVGLKATIMGDVEIGAGATIAPHEVILPKSRIAPGRKPTMNNTIEMNNQNQPTSNTL
ncbi:MAG: hypothetical protein H6696_16195 [Deferribacteres bacterium]|nr:hypothetical protein [candidate division KSB1 bacterium]MCB9503473.1 hypothetical protein [Deferribacteres bacterium]